MRSLRTFRKIKPNSISGESEDTLMDPDFEGQQISDNSEEESNDFECSKSNQIKITFTFNLEGYGYVGTALYLLRLHKRRMHSNDLQWLKDEFSKYSKQFSA